MSTILNIGTLTRLRSRPFSIFSDNAETLEKEVLASYGERLIVLNSHIALSEQYEQLSDAYTALLNEVAQKGRRIQELENLNANLQTSFQEARNDLDRDPQKIEADLELELEHDRL